MPTMVEMAYEALCGALHNTDFRFLAEQGGVSYWTRGESPKAMRVTVAKDIDRVRTTIEFANISAPPRVVRTSLAFSVDCTRQRSAVEAGTLGVMQKVLGIYGDILEVKGYAGPEYLQRQMQTGPKDDRPEDDFNHPSWRD
jgi:hypothetical protein